MRVTARSGLQGALIVVALAMSSRAVASGPDPERLFIDGSALLDQGRCAEGLPMLEQAQKLDPGIGTQFNIALCNQQLGRLGTAWRNFAEVEKIASAGGKKRREEAAHAKLVELRTRTPSLKVRAADSDVTVSVDGEVIPAASWSFIPLDPGRHHVVATAPTKKSWTNDVAAPGEGKQLEIVVPPLATLERTVFTETSNKRRTAGFVFGGVGLVGVAASVVTGIMLLDARSTADDRCAPQCVDAEGVSAVTRGKTLLPINAVAWGVAAIGLGVGTYLLLTSSSSSSSTTTPTARTTRIDAVVSPQGGSLRVSF